MLTARVEAAYARLVYLLTYVEKLLTVVDPFDERDRYLARVLTAARTVRYNETLAGTWR